MTMKLGGEWISNTDAQVGLLHVLSVNLAKTGDKNITETIPGKSNDDSSEQQDMVLTQAYQQLRSAGVKNEIISLIRQGLVVEEVLNEVNQGGYELLVIGAHYQPGQDRWQGTLLDDVADQLLNRSTCSVLII
jgi:nucleotide-binding universal stress UspA family protein